MRTASFVRRSGSPARHPARCEGRDRRAPAVHRFGAFRDRRRVRGRGRHAAGGADRAGHLLWLIWTDFGNLVFMLILGGFDSLPGRGGRHRLHLPAGLVMSLTTYWRFVFGAILAVLVIFVPRGLLQTCRRAGPGPRRDAAGGGRCAEAVRDVHRARRREPAVGAGEVRVDRGPNGAGKTHARERAQRADAADRRRRALPRRRRRRPRLGRWPAAAWRAASSSAQLPALTVAETLAVAITSRRGHRARLFAESGRRSRDADRGRGRGRRGFGIGDGLDRQAGRPGRQ